MSLSRRFLLIFCGAILCSGAITALLAVHSLHQAYMLFTHATHPELIPVMAGRMYTKAVVSFCLAMVVCIGLALPLGIYLLRQISRPYLYIFEHLSDIAHQRMKLDESHRLGGDVLSVVRRYLDVLLDDLRKLQDFEKEKEWKNGARMLMHELKNPLTPLKLATESLLVQAPAIHAQEELGRIATATRDIENILGCFKELVNIEFGPKERFDAVEFLKSMPLELAGAGIAVRQTLEISNGTFPVLSERGLLKMAYINLVNNGVHENSAAFSVVARQDGDSILVEFITPDRTIENPSRVFKLGYSTKGDKRGFGLFLCRKISDYLDLDLSCRSADNRVVFSLRLAGSVPAQ
jgi:signal transduction histidine kinase